MSRALAACALLVCSSCLIRSDVYQERQDVLLAGATDTDLPVDPDPECLSYEDADGDGFGNPASTSEDCDTPAGYVDNDGDCDDRDPGRRPGLTESCDGVDEDCNDIVDDGATDCFGDCRLEHFEGSAYLFCEDGEHWSDASDACDQAGYHVVKVDDAQEQAGLEFGGGDGDGDWWLGLIYVDGDWQWAVDGTPAIYENFVGPTGGFNGLCAVMRGDGRWIQDSCEEGYHDYICEANL